MHTRKPILEELRDRDIKRVKVGGFDIDGVLRGKFISFDKLASALENGLGFCDVIFGWDCADELYDNVTFTGWHTGYPDLAARIDPGTLRLVPWEPGTALLLLDFFDAAGEPLPISPQQVLRRVVRKARELGYEPLMSAEFEFFIFSEQPHSASDKGFRDLKHLSPGMFGYSVLRASMHSDLVSEILDYMAAYDCPIEGIHTETGPGVYEVALTYGEAVKAAQQAALFKTGMKEIAHRHGLIASFMAKFSQELPGCSGHTHQSLWNADKSRNLFAGADGDPSDLLRHYVAGLVRTMPEFAALYAPTVNSYKRLVKGAWAPTNASWGPDNRTVAARVISGPSSKATRIELRMTGSDINPFIAFAGALAAGLYGIEEGLEPPPPCLADAYAPDHNFEQLPRTLGEAAEALDESEIARRYLGDEFVDHYVSTRRWEVRQFQRAVTQWELERYFEVI
jgi:glutamine synthetase